MTHQFDVLAGQKGAGLSRYVRARIVMVSNGLCSLVRFRISPETLGKQIDIPTTLKWNSRHMTSFAEEIGQHWLRSDFCTNNFRWIWLRFKDQHSGLLLCFGVIRHL